MFGFTTTGRALLGSALAMTLALPPSAARAGEPAATVPPAPASEPAESAPPAASEATAAEAAEPPEQVPPAALEPPPTEGPALALATSTAPTDAAGNCTDMTLRSTPGCAPYRKWATLNAVGWPTLIVSWAASAAIASTGFDDAKESNAAAIGVVPVIGAPIAAGVGNFSLGARLGLATTGVVQIAGLVLGIVGAVKMRRTVNPTRLGLGGGGIWLKF
jgi:hypothetical protein